MGKKACLLVLLLLSVFLPSGRTEQAPELNAQPSSSLEILRAELENIFSDPNLSRGQWGVKVVSLDRSEILYEKDASKLLIPASNNKILTAAAALLRLGPDYQYKTRVMTDGKIVDGTLKGNLIIAGSGDPSTAPRFNSGDAFKIFKEWAANLKELGITAIHGNLIGDVGAFGEDMLGNGWEWNDLVQSYSAPASALQFNENIAAIEIRPGRRMDRPASVKTLPLENYPVVDAIVETAPANSRPQIEIKRGSQKDSLEIRGSVPLRGATVIRMVPVQSPVRYYLQALRLTLAAEGIDTKKCMIKETRGIATSSMSLLWTHTSPPLDEILSPLLKISQNLYAETLVRTLGAELRSDGSFTAGKEVLEDVLGSIGIEKDTYSYADGSGLSRLNLASADLLVGILSSMYHHSSFAHFYNAMPVAGSDGTLELRMKGTKAENNVHAKTGSIANVCSISGYVHTADGEILAFSLIANNFIAPKDTTESAQDKALELLADFSRKQISNGL
jgi:D-alanyl-D-alanine carboxypeptidase/D-alanyl-D-alanine-endopeptidase (penicillin-binding protein 4)